MDALGVFLIFLVAGAPWLIAIAYYWRRMPRDEATPSLGEQLRQRLIDR